MYRALAFILAILPTLAFAQRSGQWTEYRTSGGCVGGDGCPNRRLSVPIEDKPVLAVRFRAHDQIGNTAGGVLRVKIDGNTVRGYIDIPRKGELFTIDVDELTGRQLIFEPVEKDEVEITDIAVLYSRDGTIRRRDRDRDGGVLGGVGGVGSGGGRGAGWRSYPAARGCIGGDECRKNGSRITIAIEDAPVLGVRFYAHDNMGQRADGKLRVRVDDTTIGWTIDVQRNGKRHELDVESLRGSKLVIETANDDEVEIRDVEVLYGRRGSGGGGYGGGVPRDLEHEGDCIGGNDCGGRSARIRIPLRGYAVESIRFYARDDIGAKAGGELRIRIDDEILRDYLDIPREGRTFTIDGKGIAGDYLFIEPAENDEVEVKDIRIKFSDEDR